MLATVEPLVVHPTHRISVSGTREVRVSQIVKG
jgi:hypothetical protein